MKMTLKVLAPVRIGSRQLTPLDFVCLGQKVHIVDFELLGKQLQKKNLVSDLVNWALLFSAQRQPSIALYLRMKNLLREDFLKEVSVRQVNATARVDERVATILEQLTDALSKQPVIPGSSIKGAIRSSLTANVLAGKPDLSPAFREAVERWRRDRNKSGGPGEYLAGTIFKGTLLRGGGGPNKDWFRCLRITDAFPIRAETAVVPVKVFSISGEYAVPKNYTMWVECILPGSEFEFDMTWDLETATRFFRGRPPFESVEQILSGTRIHVERICREEASFVEKYGPKEIARHFHDVGSRANLRLGWGCGWLSTTIGSVLSSGDRIEVRRACYSFRPREGFPFPKYRRFQVSSPDASGRPLSSFGWVSVTPRQ